MLSAAPAQPSASTPVSWSLSLQQVLFLAEELVIGSQTMGAFEHDPVHGDPLLLEVRLAGTVKDDNGKVNERPILSFSLAEYPDEGVYPIDPVDCKSAPAQPSPAESQHDRTLFEAYCQKEYGGMGVSEPWDEMQGCYPFGPDNTRFQGWRARASLSAEPLDREAIRDEVLEDERNTFEKYWYEHYSMASTHARSNGTYFNSHVQCAWEAWQACAFLKSQPAQSSDTKCNKCGQIDDGQTGEYPCSECGLPTVHDEPAQLSGNSGELPSGSQAEVSDSEMLDFIDKKSCVARYIDEDEYALEFVDRRSDGRTNYHGSMRAAIKAAMRAQEGK